MAAAIDLGDPTSPWDPIHPRYKQEVGRRLAQAVIGARYAQYGGVHYSGPKFVDAYPLAIAPEANNGVKGYRLTFENGNGGAAPATLHSSAAASCSQTGSGQCCNESPFIVVDAKTGNSVRVPYWLDNAGDNGAGAVVISTDLQVKEVRYAWERFPQCLVRLFFLIYVWAISVLTSCFLFVHSCIMALVGTRRTRTPCPRRLGASTWRTACLAPCVTCRTRGRLGAGRRLIWVSPNCCTRFRCLI